ncbi:MAG: BamA/TamA family outer membrane protein, partial [Rhodospirillales bacterium]
SRFGPLTILGLGNVREDYVRTLVPWQEGDPYDQRKVDAFRAKLIKAGIFTTVVIDRPEQLDENGTLPMTVQLIEGKQRSIGAGAKYYTSEGPAGEVFWEHRNLFGRDEDLRITVELGEIRQQGTIDFTKPNWRRPDQDLLSEIKATRQTTEAFDEIGVASVVKLRRPVSETWTGSVGTSLEWSQLKDENGQNTSTLIGFPLELYRDATDSLLDPREGMRLRLQTTPDLGWFDGAAHFLSSAAIASGYQPLDKDKRIVLAGRAKIGTILGQSRQDIPANKRFYAGGGDSIRGYQFQKVGPLDDDKDPLGGRSVVELNAELRAHVWGKFSLVPFVDGGNVYNAVYPDFSEQLRWAAGIGARYDTVVGPVRFDVAFPINPPKELNERFQFYISLGQAF